MIVLWPPRFTTIPTKTSDPSAYLHSNIEYCNESFQLYDKQIWAVKSRLTTDQLNIFCQSDQILALHVNLIYSILQPYVPQVPSSYILLYNSKRVPRLGSSDDEFRHQCTVDSPLRGQVACNCRHVCFTNWVTHHTWHISCTGGKKLYIRDKYFRSAFNIAGYAMEQVTIHCLMMTS